MKRVIGPLLAWLIVVALGFGIKMYGPGTYAKVKRKIDLYQSGLKDGRPVRVAGDSYAGYFFITSPEMRKEAARRGITIAFTDDKGDYATRLKKFSDKEYDAIVLPVDRYLQHGRVYTYPGDIVAAIAESKGADGILAFADKLPTGKVQDLNNDSLRVVFIPESPNEFLLDLTKNDFDLFNLLRKKEMRVEVSGPEEALARAKKRDGDVFVFWEPQQSQALRENPNLRYVWGTDKFRRYVVDVVVFRRDFVRKNEDDVLKFFESYFAAMRTYGTNRDLLVDDLKGSTGLKKEEAEAMLQKIEFYDLTENARRMFGIKPSPELAAEEGVVNTLIACFDILRRTGKLPKNEALDPYSLVKPAVLEKLMKQIPAAVGNRGQAAKPFTALADDAWNRLKEVGTMRVEPISFDTGMNLLDREGKEQVDKVAPLLKNNYPNYRIAVRGHTGYGDETANRQLSNERAQAVTQYLVTVHGIDPNRLHAQGYGASQPPARHPEEGERLFRARMARVEFVLLEGMSF